MQFRYAVHLVAHHYRQPGHTHLASVVFVNDGNARQQLPLFRVVFLNGLQEVVIDFKNNLQMTRQDFTDHIYRPGFQRLAHQRVVGVGEDLTHHLECVVPGKLMLIDQQTHQFRDRQHRVGVVQVDGDLIREVIESLMHFPVTVKDILHGGRYQKILLTQAQLAA